MANMFVQQDFDKDVTSIESNGAFGTMLPCTFIRDIAFTYSGAGALKVTWPAPSGVTSSWVNHVAVSGFDTSRWYEVKAMIYVPPGNPDIAGFVIFQYGPGPVMSTKGQWVEYKFAFKPTGANCFIGWGTPGPPSAGGIAWIDNISVDLLVHPAELDADLPRPLVGPTPNYFKQRDFETDSRFMESNTAFNSKLASTYARSTEQAHSGTSSLKVTMPTPDGVKGTWVDSYEIFKPLTVGRRYRFTAWLYNPSGNQNRFKLDVLFVSSSSFVSTKDQWVMLEHEFVATNTGHHLGVTTGSDPTVGGIFYTDDWRLAEVPAYQATLDAVLAAVTGSIFGRLLRRMVYTVTGWQVLYRRKWPGS